MSSEKNNQGNISTTSAVLAFVAVNGLTRRQAEVLVTVIEEGSRESAARALGIGVETVKSHVKKALHKCGMSSTQRLVIAGAAARA